MTTTTAPARTLDAIEAEIAATSELRDKSTGSKKGMLTKKLGGLIAEQAHHPDYQAPDAAPAEAEAQPSKPQVPETFTIEVKIHDSDLIDGVRYSVDVNGNVWEPNGDVRLGAIIGRVERDEKGVWHGSYCDPAMAPDESTSRSRRDVLREMVRTHDGIVETLGQAIDEEAQATAAASELVAA